MSVTRRSLSRAAPLRAALVALALATLAIAACDNRSFYSALGNKISGSRLAIAPATVTLPVSRSVAFSASGGASPYTYSMVSGLGSINAATGLYTASATADSETVQVKDKTGATATASVTVTSTVGPIAISPPAVTLNSNGTVTFVASGGTPPYTYSISTVGSAPPAPTIGATTGAYTAGANIGTDTVKVTDAASSTATATVTITAATTSIDYSIPTTNLPTGGTGGTTLTAGFTFTVKNIGSANGTKPVSFWVFLSPNPAPGAGTVLLQTGTAAAGGLGAGASTAVPLSWTWPTVPPVLPGQTCYLYVMISAADDLNTANNTFTGGALTVAPPNVDYTVASVTNSGGTTHAGTALSGTINLQNIGTAGGGQPVSWTAYLSTDSSATIDASAVPIATGTTGPLSAPGSAALGFTGTWPATPGTYYLKAQVSAADDVNATNDVQVSSAIVTTIVDYSVTAVGSTGGTVSGGPLSGSFTATNVGSANGGQTISWAAYASTSTTLGAGSTLVASGTTAALNAAQFAPVTFTGTWPTVSGTYYLIATVAASDDPNPANNLGVSGALAINPANVDYNMLSVAVTGGTTNPAGAVNGNLQFNNIGPNSGTQFVTWQVYASRITVLDGTAVLLASGTNPPLASGASSLVIPFSGSWPLTYGSYYLIAKVSAPVDVDVNPANNVAASASATTIGVYPGIEPNDDYLTLTNPTVLPITLQPGMSIELTGTLSPGDPWDVFQFNTGTAASVSFSMSWGSNATANMYVLIAGNTSITGVGVTAAKSLSLLWSPVDLAATNRWLALNDAAGNMGAYTLIVNAN